MDGGDVKSCCLCLALVGVGLTSCLFEGGCFRDDEGVVILVRLLHLDVSLGLGGITSWDGDSVEKHSTSSSVSIKMYKR